MSNQARHISVLLREAIEALELKPSGTYIDGTLGAGGHAFEIASRLDPAQGGQFIGFDLDPKAIEIAKSKLKTFGEFVNLINKSYAEMGAELEKLDTDGVDGILLDLGYSSMQIDDPERGFSFQHDAPLDMRFNPSQSLTAAKLINELSKEQLIRIFREYGEERWSARIAERIVEARAKARIETTARLSELILEAVPKSARYPKSGKRPVHPATRVFQALRIAVNSELETLSRGLEVAFEVLKSNGLLVVISFHSLEDRIVKQFMRSKVQGCTCPTDLPLCVCGFEPTAEVLADRAPSADEIEANPRARSARLRALRKL